jgi:hypothetical protein
VTAAVANLGGENENGAFDTTVSVEEEGRANEKAGLFPPNENAAELVVTAAELGVVVTPKTGVVVEVGVAAATPNLIVAGADVVTGVGVEKLKEGAAEAGVVAAAGTPNFMPLNAGAPVEGVDENVNPVLAGVVVTVVVLNAVVVVEATDATEGIPNFI